MKITSKEQLQSLTPKEMQQPIDIVGLAGIGLEWLTKLITALSNVTLGKWKIQRNINVENARNFEEIYRRLERVEEKVSTD